jgi:hypothetical protein
MCAVVECAVVEVGPRGLDLIRAYTVIRTLKVTLEK